MISSKVSEIFEILGRYTEDLTPLRDTRDAIGQVGMIISHEHSYLRPPAPMYVN